MSFASQGNSSQRSNDSLLKKKSFFDFHQSTIQKYFFKGQSKKRKSKKLTAKQIDIIRRDLEFDKRRESNRKLFVLAVSLILTIIFMSIIVFVFMEYVF